MELHGIGRMYLFKQFYFGNILYITKPPKVVKMGHFLYFNIIKKIENNYNYKLACLDTLLN